MKERAIIFWEWFREHTAGYLFLSQVDDEVKTNLLEDLKAHLQAYCDKLCFEIGGDPEAEHELIITAEGDKSYFEYAEFLVAEAPKLDGWKFFALIPPRGADFEITINEHKIQSKDMWFQPMGNPCFPDIIGLRICLPNYEAVKDQEWILPAMAKIAEYILGEKSFALNIQYIDIGELPENPPEWRMIPLTRLEQFVSWRKRKGLETIISN